MTTAAHVARKLLSQPLAMDARAVARWAAAASGGPEPVSFGSMLDEVADSGPAVPTARRGGLGIARVSGVMLHEADYFDRVFLGAIEYGEVAQAIDELAADESVAAVVLDMNTPGGTCAGQSDVIAAIGRARRTKPVYAVAHEMVCSAGMYLASACDDLLATSTSEVGSIGTMMYLIDDAQWFDKIGLRAVAIASGEFKAIGYGGLEITDEQAEYLRGRIEPNFEQFVASVAAFTGMEAQAVRDLQAGVYFASEAEAIGLCRTVPSFTDALDLIQRTVDTLRPAQSKRAEASTSNPSREARGDSARRGQESAMHNDNRLRAVAEDEKPDAGVPDYESMDDDELEAHLKAIKAAMGDEDEDDASSESDDEDTPSAESGEDEDPAEMADDGDGDKDEDQPGATAKAATRAEINEILARGGKLSQDAKAFAFDAMDRGLTVVQVSREWAEHCEARADQRVEAATKAAEAAGLVTDPVSTRGGKPKSMDEAVDAVIQRGDTTDRTEAYRIAAREHPELAKA